MKIVVFDDDPTGSQSVYGCPLILKWDEDTIVQALEIDSPLLFILANTRSMSSQGSENRTREICRSIKSVFQRESLNLRDVLVVSRGDSTLRGHGCLEPAILENELGPFDATFHVPAFLEGGRTTVNGVHLLNGIPVHLSNFASDQIFGYSTSFLPDWLEEKSHGSIASKSVLHLTIEQLQSAIETNQGIQDLMVFLRGLSDNVLVVVDAQESSHLSIFANTIIKLMSEKRFLFRSAASLISAFAELPSNVYSRSSLVSLRLRDKDFKLKPGIIIVGSHVVLADQQLHFLLKDSHLRGIEIPVKKIARVLEGSLPDILLEDLEIMFFSQVKKILSAGKTPVIYTTRGELQFASSSKRISFGLQLAELIARLVGRLSNDLGYVISKGGITTQSLLDKGFNLSMVELKGQIMPGLSMVCSHKNNGYIQFPIITFPGNLGDETTLFKAWKIMDKDYSN